MARLSFFFPLASYVRCGLILVTAILAAHQVAHSQVIETPSFTVCSQNLKNYGLINLVQAREAGTTKASFALKETGLVTRFIAARCDVIALEEIVGRTDENANDGVNQLANALKKAGGRTFTSVIADTGDGFIRSGMLIANDRAKLLQAVTYDNVELPKLVPEQKPRFFERPPVEVQLEASLGKQTKLLNLIIYHLKSKANAKGDAAGLAWETYRMEMAEALRKIVEIRHKQNLQDGSSVLMVLGDRNANFDTATAKILEGVVTLNDFRTDGPCRLSKRGVPICKPDTLGAQKLFSVLTLDPQTKLLPGTFIYKKEFSWLDDISMPLPSLPFARERADVEGDYDSFVVRTFGEASDHALVGVRLRF